MNFTALKFLNKFNRTLTRLYFIAIKSLKDIVHIGKNFFRVFPYTIMIMKVTCRLNRRIGIDCNTFFFRKNNASILSNFRFKTLPNSHGIKQRSIAIENNPFNVHDYLLSISMPIKKQCYDIYKIFF